MTLGEYIKELQQLEKKYGSDIKLYRQENDGRSTYSVPARARIEFREIWPKHPDGKRYYLV